MSPTSAADQHQLDASPLSGALHHSTDSGPPCGTRVGICIPLSSIVVPSCCRSVPWLGDSNAARLVLLRRLQIACNVCKLPPALHAQVQLERVLGITACHNNAVCVNKSSGDIAYPAGCMVCLYNAKRNRQVRLAACPPHTPPPRPHIQPILPRFDSFGRVLL